MAAAKVASNFVSESRAQKLRESAELRSADQVAQLLGEMKGAMMKLGQMASYIDQGLPQPVRDALAQLQQDAPPMAAELAIATVEEELGDSIDALFAEFEPVPLASASIGQVHRAVLPDGRDVVVKVQYPGIADIIRADLHNVDALFSAMGVLFSGMDPATIVEELKERLSEELDYGLEALNQQMFADWYRGHPTITVPNVIAERSSARVLTSEFHPGVRWDALLGWSQAERDLAAETLYRFVFGGIYRLHAFNGDPHPGNYLFQPGGRVTFLDFGLVKRFTPSEVEQFQRMIIDMQSGDAARYRATMEDMGLLAAGAPFEDEQIMEYFSHFYSHVNEDAAMTIDPEWSAVALRRYFDVGGEFGGIIKSANLPSSMVLVQRINLGLFALLGELRATANWRRMAEEIWPHVKGPPSTPMGEAIADWEHQRAAADPGWQPWPEA
jgi:predicted unusual protein kinase regulating ubiquinone biosynthesis (AarF/ABC1/UbiB family)